MNYDVVYGLGFCIYIIVTVIMWRNIQMPLFFKAIFCLLAVPVFFFGIVGNLWLFEMIYPEMFEIHANAQGGFRGGEKGLFAVVLVLPLALAMSYGWYRLMRSFNPEPI
ncbi:MAG: hypothetical protein ACI9ZT_002251 [Gammaproteobacteria bacterium]|jgi:hypothetical protein